MDRLAALWPESRDAPHPAREGVRLGLLYQHRVKGARPTQHNVAEPVRVQASDVNVSRLRPSCSGWLDRTPRPRRLRPLHVYIFVEFSASEVLHLAAQGNM